MQVDGVAYQITFWGIRSATFLSSTKKNVKLPIIWSILLSQLLYYKYGINSIIIQHLVDIMKKNKYMQPQYAVKTFLKWWWYLV